MVKTKTRRVAAFMAVMVNLGGFMMAPGRAKATETEPKTEDGERIAKAKQLFEEGNRLREEGKLVEALQRFKDSRAVYPSYSNTKNVAATLYRLGQHSQALSAYWALLTQFDEELTTEDRKGICTTIRELEAIVAARNAPRDEPDKQAPSKKAVPAKPHIPTPHVFRADLIGGVHLASALGSAGIGPCTNGWATLGGSGGARLGYSLHKFFTVEITGGFLGLGSECQQQSSSTFGGPLPTPTGAAGAAEKTFTATYQISGDTEIRSGFVTAGLSYRRPLHGPLSLVARSSVGVLRGSASSTTSVTVSTDGYAPIDFPKRAGSANTAFSALLLSPEIGVELHFAKLRLGITLGATILPVTSGSFGSQTFAKPSAKPCSAEDASAGAPWCARNLSFSGSKIGPTVAASPGVALGYDF